MSALVPLLRQRLDDWHADGRSDIMLLRDFARGAGDDSFRLLIARHGAMVWRVCRSILGDEHAAEDAFQATFLAISRRAGALATNRFNSVAGWLHLTARRAAMKARLAELRRRSRETAHESPRSTSPAEEMSARELFQVLDEELARLPERYREPLLLCFWQGLTQDEAAQRLGLTPGAVKGRLERGRARLAQRLTRRGIAPAILLTLAGGLTLPHDVAAKALERVRPGAAVPASVAALLAGSSSRALRRALVALMLLAAGGIGIAALQPAKPQAVVTTDDKPPEKVERPTTDAFGDPLPEGAIARVGSVRLRHGDRVEGTAVSPDGSILATGGCSDDPAIVLWDAKTGREIRRLELQPGRSSTYATRLAFSPDGTKLAAGTQGMENFNPLFVFDVATGKQLFRAKGHALTIMGLAFTPDGSGVATTAYDGAVHLWDANTGALRRTVVKSEKGNFGLAISADGALIAAGGSDSTICVWKLATGDLVQTLRGHKGATFGVAFSRDGKRLASGGGGDRLVRCWDLGTGKEIAKAPGHDRDVAAVRFLPGDRTIVSAGRDGTIRIWDAQTGKEQRKLAERRLDFMAFDMTPDGKILIAGGSDNGAFVYDLAAGKELLGDLVSDGWVQSLDFSPDGKTLAVGYADKSVRLADARTGRVNRRALLEDGWWVKGLAFAPDGRTLAAAALGPTTHLLDARTAEPRGRLKTAGDSVRVAYSRAGTLATVEQDGSVRLWDASAGRELRRMEGSIAESYSPSLAVSADGKYVAALAHVTKNRAGAPDRTIRVWDSASGKLLHTLAGDGNRICLRFTPDGQTLVSGGDDIRLWDATTGRELRRFAHDQTSMTLINSIDVSPSGRWIVLGRDRRLEVWEMATAQYLRGFAGHRGWVQAVRFAPDGKTFASGSMDGTALVWELLTASVAQPPIAATVTALQEGAPSTAFAAMGQLKGYPKHAIELLRPHLQPVAAIDVEQVKRLLGRLESDKFAEREAAQRELDQVGPGAEMLLRDAALAAATPETRRRLEKSLARFESAHLFAGRALDVLEQMATPEAKQLLESLAKGAPDAWLTREAAASLRRMRD